MTVQAFGQSLIRYPESGHLAANFGCPVLDHDLLLRQCLGDLELADELLVLFVAQAALVGARLRKDAFAPDAFANIAHLLKGSAAAIGALQVVELAQHFDSAWRNGTPDADTQAAQLQLAAALDVACAAIAALRSNR